MAKKKITKERTTNTNELENIRGAKRFFSDLDTKPKNDYEKITDDRRVIILDINPGNDQITNELITDASKQILKEMSTNRRNILIFATYSKFDVIYEYVVKNLGIKRGYIICNGGARLYDIKHEKFLFDSLLTHEQKSTICHFGCVLSIYMLASTLKQDLGYSLNTATINKLTRSEYLPRNHADEYLTFYDFIKLNNVCSYIMYEPNDEELAKRYTILKSLAKELHLQLTTINNNMFVINNYGADFVYTTYKIMQIEDFENFDDVSYVCFNCFCTKLWYFSNASSRYICMDHYINNHKVLPIHIDYEQVLFLPSQCPHLLESINNGKHFSASAMSRNQIQSLIKKPR